MEGSPFACVEVRAITNFHAKAFHCLTELVSFQRRKILLRNFKHNGLRPRRDVIILWPHPMYPGALSLDRQERVATREWPRLAHAYYHEHSDDLNLGSAFSFVT